MYPCCAHCTYYHIGGHKLPCTTCGQEYKDGDMG